MSALTVGGSFYLARSSDTPYKNQKAMISHETKQTFRECMKQRSTRRAGRAECVGRAAASARGGGGVCGRRRAGPPGGDLRRGRLAAGAGPLHHLRRAAHGRSQVRVCMAPKAPLCFCTLACLAAPSAAVRAATAAPCLARSARASAGAQLRCFGSHLPLPQALPGRLSACRAASVRVSAYM